MNITEVSFKVVADLGHDISQGLGQDHIEHGLKMVHANGLCALGLAGINGEDATADGFCHICAGVDGYHQNCSHPHVGELHLLVGEVRQTIIDEYRLQYHGGAAKYFHINPHNGTNQRQEKALHGMIRFCMGDGL